MADCVEVITRRRIKALLQTALETTTLNGALNNVSLSITVTAYPLMWPLSGNFSFIVDTETIVVTAGHGTTTLTVTRAAPVSHLSLASCGLTASRVYLGVKDLAVDADFFRSLVTTGPAIQVRPAVGDEQDWQGHFSYTVTIRAYYGYAKNADNDFTVFENTNGAARAALGLASNYTGSTKGNPPESGKWMGPEEDVENQVGIVVKYELTLPFLGAFQ